jgi:hypothetical protein
MDFSSLPGHTLLKTETWYALVCRPALPKDCRGVLDLTRRIWSGRDYVPNAWDEWLRDTGGMTRLTPMRSGIYKTRLL